MLRCCVRPAAALAYFNRVSLALCRCLCVPLCARLSWACLCVCVCALARASEPVVNQPRQTGWLVGQKEAGWLGWLFHCCSPKAWLAAAAAHCYYSPTTATNAAAAAADAAAVDLLWNIRTNGDTGGSENEELEEQRALTTHTLTSECVLWCFRAATILSLARSLARFYTEEQSAISLFPTPTLDVAAAAAAACLPLGLTCLLAFAYTYTEGEHDDDGVMVSDLYSVCLP